MTHHISRITKVFRDYDDTGTSVRAANRWRNLLDGTISREPIDNLYSAKEIGEAYEKRFFEIYKDLRAGRSQFDKRVEQYGFIRKYHEQYLDDSEREFITRAFQEFAHTLFDEKGNPHQEPVDVPDTLYTLYRTLRNSNLYNTQAAFGFLLCEMSLVAPNFKENFAPDRVDFSRADHNMKMKIVLAQALDKSRDIPAKDVQPFIPLPGKDMETYINIDGCSFAIHRLEGNGFAGGQWHLVLRDGSLVNATDEVRKHIEEHLKAGKPIDDIDLRDRVAKDHNGKPLNVIDYINPSVLEEMGKEPRRQFWEGMKACRDKDPSKATLLCLDQDEATRLRMDSTNNQLQEFNDFLKGMGLSFPVMMEQFCRRSGTPQERANAVWENIRISDGAGKFAAVEEPLKQALIKAYEAARKEVPENCEPRQTPHFFSVQGSTGTGKSNAERLIKQFIGEETYTRASLDDSRPLADPAYWLGVATNNHHFDYMNFTSFGEMVRAGVTELAMQHRQHLLLDTSMIPWRGKNEAIAEKFYNAGCSVWTFGTATPLVLQDDGSGRYYATALINTGARGSEQQRYVPLVKVVVGKAVNEPIAVQNAQASKAIHGYIMIDSTIEGTKPILAYSVDIPEELIPQLQTRRDEGEEAFKTFLKENGALPEWIEKRWAKGGKQPNFAITLDHGDGMYRAMIITDNLHIIRAQEKGVLCSFNPDIAPDQPPQPPRGVDDLLSYKSMPWDIAGRYQGKNGQMRLTYGDVESFRKTEWPVQRPLLQSRPSDLETVRALVSVIGREH